MPSFRARNWFGWLFGQVSYLESIWINIFLNKKMKIAFIMRITYSRLATAIISLIAASYIYRFRPSIFTKISNRKTAITTLRLRWNWLNWQWFLFKVVPNPISVLIYEGIFVISRITVWASNNLVLVNFCWVLDWVTRWTWRWL